MRHLSKKRFLVVGGAVTTVAAGAALIAGATFGFFSSAGEAGGENTFTAGTVVVGLDPLGTQVTCVVGPMSPGDTQSSGEGSDGACKYAIEYTGNVDAYMALDLEFTGAPGGAIETPYGGAAPTAAQGLYDGSATGLQFTITDNATVPVTYMSGVQYDNEAGTATTLTPSSGEATVTNLLVNATPINTGEKRILTVNYTLPSNAGNAYNLATSTLTLTIHAVQADNHVVTVGCAITEECVPSGAFVWS